MTTKKGLKFIATYDAGKASNNETEALLRWERMIYRWLTDVEERVIRLEKGES